MHDESVPRFVQGVFEFAGQGLAEPVPLDGTGYRVPPGAIAQPVYFRGGNSTDEMIYVALCRDAVPMRLFPIGARDATHVSLRVVEDLFGDTELDLRIAAPKGCTGSVVVDLGLVEI